MVGDSDVKVSQWFIVLNIALLIGVAIGIKSISKQEAIDVYAINKKFVDISGNKQCIDYLQTVTSIPYWRFSMFTGAGYTMLLFLIYLLSGMPITKNTFFGFWLLFLLNCVFVYKMIATRDFHYICKNNCIPKS